MTTQQPTLFPVAPAAVMQPQPLTAQPMAFAGLGNINSVDYWYNRAGQLESENRALADKVRKYELDEAVRGALEQQPEKGLGFVDGLTGFAKENPELVGMIIDKVGNLLGGLAGKGGSSGSDLQGEKGEKIKAILELSKSLPEPIIDLFLNMMIKAAGNPEAFMQGVAESQQQPENNTTDTTGGMMPFPV